MAQGYRFGYRVGAIVAGAASEGSLTRRERIVLGQTGAGVRSGAAAFQTDAIARLRGAVRQMKDSSFVARPISAQIGVQERSPGGAGC